MNAEHDLRDQLARANLDDATIAHWLEILRSRLDPKSGRYMRTSGEMIGAHEVADLVFASERAKHTHQDAPQPPTDPEEHLAALRTRLRAERARLAAEQPGTVDALLERMQSPLDKIGAGR